MSGEAAQVQNETALLYDLVAAARETNTYLRVLALPQLRSSAGSVLGTATARRAFAATDGQQTTREVADLAGSSKSTVARWWQDWRDAGLAIEAGDGRVRALFTLEELELRRPAKATS